jgi:hypothetical protein
MASISGNLHIVRRLVKTAELIHLPWTENNDLVEHFFIGLTKLLSRESQLKVLQRNKELNDESFRLLDFCASKIDHSMLSNIITE